MTTKQAELDWIKVADVEQLPEGRVMTVTARTTSICLSHFDGQWAAMDNRCPHQGGPLGEGSIEKGVDGACWIRCPWHGWDFDPITGAPPGGHEDTGQQLYDVKVEDGEVFVGLEPEPDHERTVTDVMAETFSNWGIRAVFGMVGHSNLGLADALRRQTVAGNMRYIGVRHEGAAAFAASGYGKLTGKPAACLAIAGPGATNLVTGLWDAKVDRAPVLALTGQVQTQVFGPGAFQDIDLLAAFAPVTKFSQPVLTTSNHAELASLACKSAIVERDVAHLVFPDDVQTVPSDADATSPAGRLGQPVIQAAADDLEKAREMIAGAKRPFIVVGHGAVGAMDQVLSLVEALKAPVVTTFKGKGLVSDSHPYAAGVLGRSGTPIASWFMNECDLILTLGSSFANHTGIEPSKPIIQVDFERAQLGKFHPVALPVWGEIGAFCDAMLSTPHQHADQAEEIAERWAIWRAEKESRITDDAGKGLGAAVVFKHLSALCPENAVIAVDVGNNTYSFGRYFETKGQRVLMSGYLGSIGFSFPAAMGAWAATQEDPDYAGRPVISISGDGGFGQYAMEFTTAVKYGMNITHILLNNGQLGKITKEQRAGHFPSWQTDLVNPSFATFARLCGGHGIKVTEADQIADAMQQALAHDGPSLVEIMTDMELV
ncbi:thiamine pyrophosphate-dependent enzyme [Pontivivens insulae]|uniref:Thiamine pyrophosphate-containing protein YdaP n=1 Tax=Pontivivens insulae TaxID=1639689 RepID=A0A2R8AFE2_9RHOB|nr:thiamine pyrophosphate-dependent enzyme [Pontivivens insulae]RED12196.1 thiamine pyrophosphate-dependent acetolactate synthase large subunit-like protein [Pontivivens insulae]SPF30952.1 Putative thiamine pyrophosphate-containing protein YdaP [Pontivivens insulae]